MALHMSGAAGTYDGLFGDGQPVEMDDDEERVYQSLFPSGSAVDHGDD